MAVDKGDGRVAVEVAGLNEMWSVHVRIVRRLDAKAERWRRTSTKDVDKDKISTQHVKK